MKQQTEMHPILAKFHEAKEAGFEWADDAIKWYDAKVAKRWEQEYLVNKTYSAAILFGIQWGGHCGKWNLIHEDLRKQGL